MMVNGDYYYWTPSTGGKEPPGPCYSLYRLYIGLSPIGKWIRIPVDNLFFTSGKIDLRSLSRLASPFSEIWAANLVRSPLRSRSLNFRPAPLRFGAPIPLRSLLYWPIETYSPNLIIPAIPRTNMRQSFTDTLAKCFPTTSLCLPIVLVFFLFTALPED